MDAFLAACFFILGALMASFTGVLTGRLYTGQGIIAGRSRCDRCAKTLGGADLLPILSYTFTRGRARCCGARISPFAPACEVLLGASYLLAYWRLGLSTTLVVLLIALTLLAALVVYDLTHQILPPPLLIAFILAAVAFAYMSATSSGTFGFTVIVAAIFAAFFALLWGASGGRAMGLADSPLVAGLALLAGPHAFVGFLLSFWIGAIVGIALLAIPKGGATMKSEVPFAPFLALGFLIAYFTQWDPFSLTAILTDLF